MALIKLHDLDLNTKKGRDEALQRLRMRGKQHIIDDIHRLNDASVEGENDETVSEQIESIRNSLSNIDFFEKEIDRPTPTIMNWEDISIENREWLVPNWLPANTATLFTGQGGAGKSWLTLQIVCQIACGFDGVFLDPEHETPKRADYDDSEFSEPKHIVFATYEDEPAEIKRRLQALTSSFGWIKDSLEIIKEHLHLVDMRGVGSVWGPGMGNHIANTGDLLPTGEEIQQICEEKEARLLVMDPLSGAFGGNENDRTAVYDFVSAFRGWGDEQNCAMLIVGHLPKSSEGRASGFSGSTAWEASVRSMWMLSKARNKGNKGGEDEYYYALQHTKSNYARLQEEIPLIKSKYGWWEEAEDVEDAKDAYREYHEAGGDR